jgi:hypothetical protein
MPFKKGASGNPNGRTKGTPNAITRDLRGMVEELLEKEFPNVIENFSKLEPKDQIVLWLKMAEFVMPRNRHLDHDIVSVNYRVNGLPE